MSYHPSSLWKVSVLPKGTHLVRYILSLSTPVIAVWVPPTLVHSCGKGILKLKLILVSVLRKSLGLVSKVILGFPQEIRPWILQELEIPLCVVPSQPLCLVEFKDVFLEEIPRLRPTRELYFYIELIPGSVQASKSPYRMSAPELVELKLQLQELIEKGNIWPIVSLGSTDTFCKE